MAAVGIGAAGRRLSTLRLNGLATSYWKSQDLSRSHFAVPRIAQMDNSSRGYVSSCLNSKGEPVSTPPIRRGCDVYTLL